jgi:hypothetical protein
MEFFNVNRSIFFCGIMLAVPSSVICMQSKDPLAALVEQKLAGLCIQRTEDQEDLLNFIDRGLKNAKLFFDIGHFSPHQQLLNSLLKEVIETNFCARMIAECEMAGDFVQFTAEPAEQWPNFEKKFVQEVMKPNVDPSLLLLVSATEVYLRVRPIIAAIGVVDDKK